MDMTGFKNPPAPRPAPGSRAALRRRLIQGREEWASASGFDEARQALSRHLREVLARLEPECLGVYWPVRWEFNAAEAVLDDSLQSPLRSELTLRLPLTWALPFARKSPPAMHYRLWRGEPPAVTDECGIPSVEAPAVEPDVVLVPCVGYTASGFRLGYGGGYFDRWLAAHPGVTAVGVAWSFAEITADELAVQAHDWPLTLVVTDRGVLAP